MVSFLLYAAVVAGSASKKRCMDENPVACAALMNIGNALRVTKWSHGKNTNWLDTSVSVCEWEGVTCDTTAKKTTSVIGLNLAHAGIDGYIHSDIGKLTDLTAFDISGHRPKVYEDTCAEQNLHRSVIPDSFYTLTKLTKMDFEYTCIGGPVSEAIGNMTALTSIEFHGNYLNGSIPQNVAKLINLETFKFGRNPFTGPFPNVANLHQLKELSANFCSLTGQVPDIFDNFPLLEVMYFDGNGFHGSLPPSLGKCAKLWSFSFNVNNMTGPIPASYCDLPVLTDCRIGHDLNLTEYGAHYPWLQPVVGNVYDCPLPACATNNNVCDKTSPCGPNGAWKNGTIGPCSPIKSNCIASSRGGGLRV